MPSPRALLILILLTTGSAVAAAQSLADVAKQTAEQRATRATTTTDAPTPPKTVYTNKDLPATWPRPPVAAAATPAAPLPPTSAAIAATQRDAAQRHETDRLALRSTLRQAQDTLRDGVRTQEQLQRTYENSCHEHGGRVPFEMITPCVNMEFALTVTGPRALDRLRADIQRLALLLGLNPTEAVRTDAVR